MGNGQHDHATICQYDPAISTQDLLAPKQIIIYLFCAYTSLIPAYYPMAIG
jgi:hypothetical protein